MEQIAIQRDGRTLPASYPRPRSLSDAGFCPHGQNAGIDSESCLHFARRIPLICTSVKAMTEKWNRCLNTEVAEKRSPGSSKFNTCLRPLDSWKDQNPHPRTARRHPRIPGFEWRSACLPGPFGGAANLRLGANEIPRSVSPLTRRRNPDRGVNTLHRAKGVHSETQMSV
jgi:hypothetical protein